MRPSPAANGWILGRRPGHQRVQVRDRDELGRSVDRLDSAGGHPFGPQQQASGDLESRTVADRGSAQQSLCAGAVESSRGTDLVDVREGSWDARFDATPLPLHG
ncbi:MAG: hypothetical protein ACE5GB_02905 [Acidimicrobiales bacterium]